MSKKPHSFRLDEDLIARLDKILNAKGLSKSAFIEDYILTYVNFFEHSVSDNVYNCPKCKQYYGKVFNCPKCKKPLENKN